MFALSLLDREDTLRRCTPMEPTAFRIQQTKAELCQDLDHLQRTWEGIRRTLGTIERACVAINESKELMIKLSRRLP